MGCPELPADYFFRKGGRPASPKRACTANCDYRAVAADSNMTASVNGWTYFWDGENRLKVASNGNTTLEFTYDFMSRRVEKKVSSGSNVTKCQRYVYGGFRQMQAVDALNNNTPIQEFTWSPDDELQTVADKTSNALYFVHRDANRNVTELTDTNGSVAAHYEYSPFGKVPVSNGAYASSNPYRFSSEYADDETGQVYYNYRYYAPEFGRWLSRDPLKEKGGKNLYRMINNNTVNLNDLLGLQANSCCNDEPEKIQRFNQQDFDDTRKNIDWLQGQLNDALLLSNKMRKIAVDFLRSLLKLAKEKLEKIKKDLDRCKPSRPKKPEVPEVPEVPEPDLDREE